MLWRHMAAMAMEEMFRANPVDGLVLLGGCDKTIPALLMAAASFALPALVISGGPMLNGTFRGQALGCGTDVWRLSEEVCAGTLSSELFNRSESSMIRSRGHCNTMETASSMSIMAEALGMFDSGHGRHAGVRQQAVGRGARAGAAGGRAGTPGPGDLARSSPRSRSTRRSSPSRLSEGRPTLSLICWPSPGVLVIDLTLEDFDRIGALRAAAGQPATSRQVSDGGPVPGGRTPRRPAPDPVTSTIRRRSP